METTSTKLFDSNMTTNNFSNLKNCLNPNHKVCLLSCMGKMRIGKSTLLNILISKFKNLSEKAIYFKEEDNPTSVTNGADFFLFSNPQEKVDYIFIDCEGSGNYNSVEMVKLYLMVSCISNTIIFNVEKACDDQTFNTFLQQIITHMEFLSIPIPQIHILIRDANKMALLNYLKQDIQDLLEIKRKVATSIYSKFPFKNYLKETQIHFISPPVTTDEGRHTEDQSSAFYKDIVNFYTELRANSKTAINLTEQEKRINFLWSYDITHLNQGGYQTFLKSQIQNLVDANYNKVFANPQNYTTYKNCLNTYNSKLSQYETLITNLANQIFVKTDPTLANFTKESVKNKILNIYNDIISKYQAEKNNYSTRREYTSRQDPYYGPESYQEAYTEYDYQHLGYVETYCTACGNLYSSRGHRQNGNHVGGRQTHKERFLGFKIRSWETWTCCGHRDYYSFCPYSAWVHDGSARLFTQCRHAEGSTGCTAVPRTAYRNATRSVVKGSNKVYTLPEWNENMFSFQI